MKILQKIIFVVTSMVIFFFMSVYAQELSQIKITSRPGIKIYINGEFKGITSQRSNGMIIDNLRQGIYDIKAVKGKAYHHGKYTANHSVMDEILEKEFEVKNNTIVNIAISFSGNRIEVTSNRIREKRLPNDFNQNISRHNSQRNRVKRRAPADHRFNTDKISTNSQKNMLKRKEPINIDINVGDNDEWPSPDEYVPVDIMPEIIYQAPPEYSPLNDGITRTVWVKALLGKDGLVKKAIIDKSSMVDAFDKAALEAAYKNRFKPAMKDGKPVYVWVTYKVEFQ